MDYKLSWNLTWCGLHYRKETWQLWLNMQSELESKLLGFFFGFTLSSVQGLNGNPNTRQHFVAGGGQCGWLWLVVVVTRVMISVFLTYCGIFFFFVFGLMKCMRFRLSADIFGAKVLWTFLATRLAYIINNCTRGALSRLMLPYLMAFGDLNSAPGALTLFLGFFFYPWVNEIWLQIVAMNEKYSHALCSPWEIYSKGIQLRENFAWGV